MSPIYWTTDRRVCECGNALVSQEDDRCPTCEAAYQREFAYYKALYEGERPSKYDAEGLRMRVLEWRGER